MLLSRDLYLASGKKLASGNRVKLRRVRYPIRYGRPDWVKWFQARHQLDGLDSAGPGAASGDSERPEDF
ncbi:hypothetical protein CDL15_Pgr013939 [Punica granatum]|uniref:Uncharacterized protein n=1 Tax=Punica granatum TaxID=22663 RepID=A0A218WAK6_PUNGR|nr:hypothetical protein CDL15_Pgr013939 [Punica granatum]